MILATFRAGLYVYHIHSVQNYVFAEIINKKTLHNHVFSDDEVEREFRTTHLKNSEVEPLRRYVIQKYVIVEPLRRDVIQKYVILATFRLRLYASRIQRVENFVIAKVITKETLHNHVFTEFGGGARAHNHVFT